MSPFNSSGLASGFWQRLWRPSTWIMLGAGLLAADRLRWLPAAWTDTTLIALCAALTLGLGLALQWLQLRGARRREVRVVSLPLAHAIEPDTRNRLLLFLAFVAALVVLPALLVAVLS